MRAIGSGAAGEGGVQAAVGGEARQVTGGGAVKGIEIARQDQLVISLDDEVRHHLIGPAADIEGGVQGHIGVEPGDAAPGGAQDMLKLPADHQLAVVRNHALSAHAQDGAVHRLIPQVGLHHPGAVQVQPIIHVPGAAPGQGPEDPCPVAGEYGFTPET